MKLDKILTNYTYKAHDKMTDEQKEILANAAIDTYLKNSHWNFTEPGNYYVFNSKYNKFDYHTSEIRLGNRKIVPVEFIINLLQGKEQEQLIFKIL